MTTMTEIKHSVPAADSGELPPELAAFRDTLAAVDERELHALWMGAGASDNRRDLISLERVRRDIEADGLTEQEMRLAHSVLAAAVAERGEEAGSAAAFRAMLSTRGGTAQAALQYIVRGEFTAEDRMRTARHALALYHAYNECLHGGSRDLGEDVTRS